MRIAALQMNSGTEPGPNLDQLEGLARDAAGQGATYLLSPEVSIVFAENRDGLRAVAGPWEDNPAIARVSALAAELGLPIIVVVLNDGALSLIKLKQAKMQMAPRAVDFAGPRFDLLGAACGAHGVRVDTQAGFEEAFTAALAARKFTVIDAIVDPAEYMEQM